jgi:TolB protein
VHAQQPNFVIHNTQSKKMGISISYIGENDTLLENIAHIIAKDMSYSNQFFTKVHALSHAPKQVRDITDLCKQGYQFAIIINHSSRKRDIEYRVYDTTMGHMIKQASGKYIKQKTKPIGWAHHIAQKIWPVLTGQPSMFTSKIAYSKEVGFRHGIPITYICIADYDGSGEQIWVSTPTVNIAPRWGIDPTHIQLFYSEQNPTKTRLMHIDGKKHKRIIQGAHDESGALHFVIAPDGKSAAYCASRGEGSYQIYVCKNGMRKNISNNDGNNVSISFSADSKTLYFTSDYNSNQPKICAYDLETETIRRITPYGYCTCPSAHPMLNQLLYLKMVNGIMQLFIYDKTSNTHRQLTYDEGTKDECCWSPCGNYILYQWRLGRQSTIKVMNSITGEHKAITPPDVRCSYPAWSNCFLTYPIS